jgi:FkbM family methyltransferase
MKFSRFAPRSQKLYYLCRRYCDWMDGENNGNFHTNGEFAFLKSQIFDCSIIFDVGANEGNWTRMALALNPAAVIHSFEPLPEMYRRLQFAAFPNNVHLNPIGFSSQPGTRFIDVRSASFERVSPQNGSYNESNQRIPVELDTVDNYCTTHEIASIDFLKLDVEGHELLILKGAQKMIDAERILRIQFEYSRCNIDSRVLLKDFFDFFSKIENYSIYKILDTGLKKIPEYQHKLDNFKYKNFAVIHNSIKPETLAHAS